MKFARVIRLDESDLNVFEFAANTGEWAISGAFEFSDWTKDDIKGKPRQAFTNGWLGMDSYGRSTFVAVCPITETEYDDLTADLAQHFVTRYGAPDIASALPVAQQEMQQMRDMCDDQDDNTMLIVSRELEDIGVREQFRTIEAQAASLEAFAVHGT